jgi:hypothetical protein
MKRIVTTMFLLSLAAFVISCGDDDMPEDSTRLGALSDGEIESMCTELCSDAENWELECESDGATATYSGDYATNCVPGCERFKAAGDSCQVTVGDLRKLFKEPADCTVAAENTTIGFSLLTCG